MIKKLTGLIRKSAAEQSKRHIIPKVNEPVKFDELMKMLRDNVNEDSLSYSLLFYENAMGIADTKNVLKEIKQNMSGNKVENVNVIIGPEGGFSEREIEVARNIGIYILSLGDRILRTETAAVTALSILMYEMS